MDDKYKNMLTIGIALVSCFIFYVATRPCIFIKNEQGLIYNFIIKDNDFISLKYIHSVEKTEVIEKIGLDAKNALVLRETCYKSYGAGLPFCLKQGIFRQDGDWFIISDINKKLDNLDLRVSKNSKLKINYSGQDYNLFDEIDNNSVVNIRVGKYYNKYFL